MTEPPETPSSSSILTPTDEELIAILLDLGVSSDEIERATADRTLRFLVLEKGALFEQPRFTLPEAAATSGLEPEAVRDYWRALGFPDPRSGERLFTDTDIELLESVARFISEGALAPDLAIQQARVIGTAMDKIANAQVDAIDSETAPSVDPAPDRTVRTPELTAGLLALLPRVMELTWRRQLAGAARRRSTRVSAGTEGTEGVVVGFADLVGFTATTQQLTEVELAEVISRFETVAYEVVADHGGRVVKMIGDEVMFLHDHIRDGAELALALAETYRDEENLSDVRVGIACGPVLEREGDVYGNVVNLASRIVTVAYPGSVIVSPEIQQALDDDPDLEFRSIRSHYLKDIGRVALFALRRSSDTGEAPYRQARGRRWARRQFMRDRWARLAEGAQTLPEEVPGELREELLARSEEVTEPTTGQLQALSDAVIGAELDHDLEVALLADIEAARRLGELEVEAEEKAAEADIEAERLLEEIEREAKRRVEEAEREARKQIEEALSSAEERSRHVNEVATRKVKRVAEEVERKADKVEKEAKVRVERDAKKRKRNPANKKPKS